VLNTEGLEEVHLVFKRMTAMVAEGVVRWVREEGDFSYRKMSVKKMWIEYEERDREGVLTIL